MPHILLFLTASLTGQDWRGNLPRRLSVPWDYRFGIEGCIRAVIAFEDDRMSGGIHIERIGSERSRA
jgi:hypothetical protein